MPGKKQFRNTNTTKLIYKLSRKECFIQPYTEESDLPMIHFDYLEIILLNIMAMSELLQTKYVCN